MQSRAGEWELDSGFRREYLLRLPLPLAQLYNRAYNAKSARERHDNAFYLWEATIKLASATAISYYIEEIGRDGSLRNTTLDRALAQLALPSLGQWLGILREVLRTFAQRVDAESHPWNSQWKALTAARKDRPALLALYQRVKNGADGAIASEQSCSMLGVFDALVQYRNGVFGHGAGRFESFYAEEMGPLLFPAINELFAEGTWNPLGPTSAKLVYMTEIRVLSADQHVIGLRELVGLQSERCEPLEWKPDPKMPLVPNRIGIAWPGRAGILRLDPLVQFRETDLSEEVLFLNRDRNGKQIEYLSYTTGRTERDRTLLPEMALLLSRIANRTIDEADLVELSQQSIAETPSVEALWGTPDEKPMELGEYELLSELGRGGMGVVYLARQRSLGRMVALKMLPSDLGDDEVALARFRREIRHLAHCDNPHIVKLLASGSMPDGRVFYTMEYVQGSDLEQVWRELSKSDPTASSYMLGRKTLFDAVATASRKHRDRSEKSKSGLTSETRGDLGVDTSPANEQAKSIPIPIASSPLPSNLMPTNSESGAGEGGSVSGLGMGSEPQRLPLPDRENDPGGYVRRIVELVCDVARGLQTVHDQNIVHRDIKPANLMLTPDGSRIVLMDFGLAKGASHALSASRQGGLLGTLRYAAPEQLAAANIRIGPSADVRALGVTLWELLTRRRLFGEASDEASLAHDVLSADVPLLRTIDRRFDRDLEAIVARATERRVADRLPSASRLAELLQLWLDGKPLPIRSPGLGEVVWRSAREHRVVFAVGGLSLMVIMGTAIVAFVSVALAMFRAESALAASRRQGELAMETLQSIVFDIDQALAPKAGMLDIRRKVLLKASEGLTKSSVDLGDDLRINEAQMEANMQLARLFAKMGKVEGQGGAELAEQHFLKVREIGERMLKRYPMNTTALGYLGVVDQDLGDLFLSSNRLAEAFPVLERSQESFERILVADPNNPKIQRNLALTYQSLGTAHQASGNYSLAADFLQKQQAIFVTLYEKDPNNAQGVSDLAMVYSEIGKLSLKIGATKEAIEAFKKFVELMQLSVQLDSENSYSRSGLAFAHNWLSDAYTQQGDFGDALREAEMSHQMLRVLSKADPDNGFLEIEVFKSRKTVADTLFKLRKYQEAKIEYLENIRGLRELVAKNPDHFETKDTLANDLAMLASLSRDLGELQEARRFLGEAIQLKESFLSQTTNNINQSLDLAATINLMGQIVSQSDLSAAHEYYQKAIAIAEAILAKNPTNRGAMSRLGIATQDDGYAQIGMGKPQDALPFFLRSRELFEKLVQLDPKAFDWQSNLADTYGAIADAHYKLRDFSKAEKLLQERLSTLKNMSALLPEEKSTQNAIAWMFNRIGDILVEQGKLEEADSNFREGEKGFQQLSKEFPDDIMIHVGLSNAKRWIGRVELSKKRSAEAILHFQQSLEISKRLADQFQEDTLVQRDLYRAYSWVGKGYFAQGETEKAREAFHTWRDIVKLMYQQNPSQVDYLSDLKACYQNLAEANEVLKDFSGAIEARTEYLKHDSQTASEWNARGKNYATIESWEKAIADHNQAITLAPKDAAFRFDRAIALHASGKRDEAIKDFDKAIEFDPTNSKYQEKRKAVLGGTP